MKRPVAAFTLAELVVAMAVLLVTGLAAASVAVALSNLHEHSEDYHRFLESAQVASVRLPAALRRASLVTAAADDALVLWVEGSTKDGQINVSEVLKVYLDEVTHQIVERSYVFPESLTQEAREALDYPQELSEVDDAAICESGNLYPQYDTMRVLATEVREFHVQCSPAPPKTRIVEFELVVGEGINAVRIRGAAKLRADKVSQLAVSDGEYILMPPG